MVAFSATKEEIAKSLQGNWRPEMLFIVRQQLEMYGLAADILNTAVTQCEIGRACAILQGRPR
jgi:hypothetical protein